MRLVCAILLFLGFGLNVFASDKTMRSTDGKWSIPTHGINLLEGYEGEGEYRRYHGYSAKKPTIVWFELIQNSNIDDIDTKIKQKKMPKEFIFESDFKFCTRKGKYNGMSVLKFFEDKKHYSMVLMQKDRDVLIVSVWGVSTTSRMERFATINKIMDAFISGTARRTE